MSVEQQILGLEISVDNVLGVKVFEGQGYLRCVELGDRIRESLDDVSLSRPGGSESVYLGFSEQTE